MSYRCVAKTIRDKAISTNTFHWLLIINPTGKKKGLCLTNKNEERYGGHNNNPLTTPTLIQRANCQLSNPMAYLTTIIAGKASGKLSGEKANSIDCVRRMESENTSSLKYYKNCFKRFSNGRILPADRSCENRSHIIAGKVSGKVRVLLLQPY